MPILLQLAAVFSSEAMNVSTLQAVTYGIPKNNLAEVFNKPLTRLIILSYQYVILIDFWQNDQNGFVVIFIILLYSFKSALTYITTAFQKLMDVHVKIYRSFVFKDFCAPRKKTLTAVF